MYTAFYGLREKPFSLTPDPHFLFLAEPHREALAHVLYGVEQGEGFIAVTGEVGTGKTTLCRTVMQRLGSDTEIAYIFNPSLTGEELLRAINVEFGLLTEGRTRAELSDQINQFLLEMKRVGRRVLLIIDEAQNLRASTLEEIRHLWTEFFGIPQELDLPFAPKQPIIYREKVDRPQPRKDRDKDKGMAVVVGRLRECPVFDIRFVGLHHNTVRGAAGGAILTAELLRAQGYLEP